MLGNILPGSYILGDKLLGVYVAEVQANISRSTATVIFRGQAVFSSYHTKFRIPDLDIVVDMTADDEKNVPKIVFGVYGNFDEFGTTLQHGVVFANYANFIAPDIVASGPHGITLRALCDFALEHPDDNAVAWSKIGVLDFTIDQSNKAGKAPVDWKGYVYQVEQLGQTNKIYVYGANGITLLIPDGIYYGRKMVSNVGIKSKHAMVNTGSKHYFVNRKGCLYGVDANGFELLGYEEFLYPLGPIVMTYDPEENLIYICDGTTGYIYSEDSKGFTQGPPNITGFYRQDGDLYVLGSESFSIPDFDVITDIYDMQAPGNYKTINTIKINCNDVNEIQVAVDYRDDPSKAFITTPYARFNPQGVATIPCFGKEFRFRFKGPITNTDFKIEDIIIDGQIHDYMPLDIG